MNEELKKRSELIFEASRLKKLMDANRRTYEESRKIFWDFLAKHNIGESGSGIIEENNDKN